MEWAIAPRATARICRILGRSFMPGRGVELCTGSSGGGVLSSSGSRLHQRPVTRRWQRPAMGGSIKMVTERSGVSSPTKYKARLSEHSLLVVTSLSRQESSELKVAAKSPGRMWRLVCSGTTVFSSEKCLEQTSTPAVLSRRPADEPVVGMKHLSTVEDWRAATFVLF